MRLIVLFATTILSLGGLSKLIEYYEVHPSDAYVYYLIFMFVILVVLSYPGLTYK